MKAGPQRFLLGLLFLFLAAGFAGIAVAALLNDLDLTGIVTALAAGVVALWLGDMALRSLRSR